MIKKREEIFKGFIFFGFKHLFDFGLHLGHIFKKSIFYARWILQGICNFYFLIKSSVQKILIQNLNVKILKNRIIKRSGTNKIYLKKLYYPIFIIKFTKMILGIRSLIFMASKCGLTYGRGWYVCHNHVFMPFTLRYALLLGMGYSVFDWIAGCLTNFQTIFSLLFLIYREYISGFILEKKHYIFLFRLFGFNITGFWLPMFIFLPRMLESRVTNYEAGCLYAQSIAIIDSNALSGDTLLPLASNDDSFLSVNFFFYIFTLHLLKHNVESFKNWQINVRKTSKRKFFWTLYYFIFFYRSNNYKIWLKKFSKYFTYFFEKPFFYFDENQILNYMSPFGTIRFLIGYEIQDDLNFIDKFVFDYNYK
jgi:hypothetical protein